MNPKISTRIPDYIEEIADWASQVSISEIPERVLDLARTQRKSIIGAIAASLLNPHSRKVSDAVATFANGGPAPLIGTPHTVSVEDAIFAACAASMALDYDDYLCFGHTGHTAVIVPLLLSTETGSGAEEQLVAQVVANEVGSRLAGSCLVGPQSGHMWSFIHSASAALSAGRLFGLDPSSMANALSLALFQPPRTLPPGIVSGDSKQLLASEPAMMGLRSARLAAAGVRGPSSILEDSRGFFDAFSDSPMPQMLGGLGEGWATLTLSVKAFPGTSYLATAIDALEELGLPHTDKIERITVDSGMLTFGLDQLSPPNLGSPEQRLTPESITYSMAWNIGVLLTAGEFGPAQMNEEWLEANREEIASVAKIVDLNHDWDLTRSTMSAFSRIIPFEDLFGSARLRDSLAWARSRHRLPSVSASKPISTLRDIKGLASVVDLWEPSWPGAGLLAAMFKLGISELQGFGSSAHPAGTVSAERFWDPKRVDGFAMRVPARIKLKPKRGPEEVHLSSIPKGGCGNHAYSPDVVAHDKLDRWAGEYFGAARAKQISKAIDQDDPKLWRLLSDAAQPSAAENKPLPIVTTTDTTQPSATTTTTKPKTSARASGPRPGRTKAPQGESSGP